MTILQKSKTLYYALKKVHTSNPSIYPLSIKETRWLAAVLLEAKHLLDDCDEWRTLEDFAEHWGKQI